ncbi:MAG: DegT/DnrJ/EryC1/StrS family aminotransferase [Promethearchaeota archaeon]
MDIPIAQPDIGTDELEAAMETMESGWVTQGKKVEAFEESFAEYCGVKYGVAACNGTAALHIALAAMGLKRGDEVITTPLSCVATTNPIIYLGAKPIFVDVDPATLNLNPALVERKISSKTKAILPVHVFGHPVDLDPLVEVAEKSGLYVIEDAAQAHGARYKGKKVGSFGHISCFSFYADKLITTVEGGMALTNDEELAEKMRSLRSFGMSKREKFYHPILGYNYKMSDIHAAIGLVQLRKLDNYIEKRRANIDYLRRKLSHSDLKLAVELDYAFNVYYVCHILAEQRKEKIVEHLEREGIETRPLLSFIPEQPPYRRYRYNPNELHVARDAHQKGFYISNSPLLTKNELDLVTSALMKATGIQK